MRGNISSEPLWEVISAQRLSEMWHSLSSARQLAHLLTRLRHWSHLTSFASCFLSFEKTEGKKCSSEFIVGLGKRSVHRQLPAHLDWWSELNPMPPDRTQTSSSIQFHGLVLRHFAPSSSLLWFLFHPSPCQRLYYSSSKDKVLWNILLKTIQLIWHSFIPYPFHTYVLCIENQACLIL